MSTEVTDVNGSNPAYKNLTVRDTIAIAALQGILANGNRDYTHAERAQQAYKAADALLTERNKTNQNLKGNGF